MTDNPSTKRGVFSRKGAFFIGPSLIWLAALGALLHSVAVFADCAVQAVDQYATVRSVVDGDTIRLSSRELVRLIGINSPEIGYDGAASQPLAHAARKFLQTQLRHHKRIGLVFGQQRRDRHGRLLAHVLLPDGDVLRNVQQLLLENGLAFWAAIAPNTRLLDCYRTAEAKAQKSRLGVWREAYFQPKNAADFNALSPGFQLLQGKIIAVFHSKRFLWLKFNDTVALRISPKDIHNFRNPGLSPLEGKMVIARGWLFKQGNRFTMQISHPAAIEVH